MQESPLEQIQPMKLMNTEDEAASGLPSGPELGGGVSLTLPDSVPLHALVSSSGPATPVPLVRTPRATPAPPSVVPVAANAAANMEVSGQSVPEVREPEDKGARLNVNRIVGEELHHVDEEVSFEYRWFKNENIEDYILWTSTTRMKRALKNRLWYP